MGRGKKKGEKEKKSSQKYRFRVGDTVLCKTDGGWEAGNIKMLDYSLPGDPTVHPYQVKLDVGRLIYTPWDEDTVIKKYDRPWWELLMQREDLSDEEGCNMLKKLSNGKDVNARNYEDDGVLHACLEFDWIPGVTTLLELKADPNLAGNKKRRPLNQAVFLAFGVVKLLLDSQADPSLQDEDPEKDPDYESKSFEEREWHRSALHYAATKSLNLSRLLINARAEINQVDAQCKHPLHLAIEADLPEVIELLIESKASVDSGNHTIGMTSTPLINAAYRQNIELMQVLLSARADVNRQGKQGMTALHMAARSRQPKTVSLLLEAKADVSIVAAGKTAMQLGMQNGMNESVFSLDRDAVMSENNGDRNAPAELDAEMRKLLYLD